MKNLRYKKKIKSSFSRMLSHKQTKWLNVRNSMCCTRKQQQNSITSPNCECPVRGISTFTCSRKEKKNTVFICRNVACVRSCARVWMRKKLINYCKTVVSHPTLCSVIYTFFFPYKWSRTYQHTHSSVWRRRQQAKLNAN